MITKKMTSRLAGICVVALAVNVSGCMPGGVEIGPIRITSALGQGMLLRDLFLSKGVVPITSRQDFCTIPSEDELEEQFLDAGDFNLSEFAKLSRLELVETTLTASSGDFNFLSEMTIRYIPAPVDGVDQEAVVIGTASNPIGLGTVVTLLPPEDVDFLDLIRANDENDSGECPQLEFEVVARSIPTQDVTYEVELTIDAFARVGLGL